MGNGEDRKVKDMTAGNPFRLILLFALPMMAGNLFQQLYTVVDTMIVGQGVGVGALASLGAADWLVWLYYGLAMGLTQGFSILYSQEFGAGDYAGLRRTVGNSVLLTALIAVSFELIGQATVLPVLKLLDTPAEILPGAELYLRVILAGLPVSLFYNLTSSLLRALGNSRVPLYAMVTATLLNIGLDLLFVLVFRWGIGGAAAATILAQAAAGTICFLVVRKIELLKLTKEDLRFEKTRAGKLIRIGIPLSLQNSIIALGGMVLQRVINGFGVVFVAGFVATNKMYGLLETAAISYGYAVTTYVAQNFGAGKTERIRKGMVSAFFMAVLTSLAVSSLMLLFGREVLKLFIEKDATDYDAVLGIAWQYLRIMAYCLSTLYILYVFRSGLQGLGDTLMPMVSGIVEFLMRSGAALVLPRFMGEQGIYYAEILAWSGAAVFLTAAYFLRVCSMKRKGRL